MPNVLVQYRLRRHPFNAKAELRPIKEEIDRQLWVPLGEAGRVETICCGIGEAASASEPHVVLVYGRSGFGVSSSAHSLLYHYMTASELDAKRFVLIENTLSNDNTGEHLSALVGKALRDVNRKRISLGEELTKELNGYVANATAGAFNASLFGMRMESLATELHDRGLGCGVLIEGVRSVPALNAVLEAFADVPCLVVLTVGDFADDREPIIRTFQSKFPGPEHLLALDSVRAADIATIAAKRWKACADPLSAELPFEAEGFGLAFGDQGRPLKRAIQLMQAVLEQHSRKTDVASTWPESRSLYISSADFAAFIQSVEEFILNAP